MRSLQITLFLSAMLSATSALAVNGELLQPSSFHSNTWQPLHWTVGLESETEWMIPEDARRLWGSKSVASGGVSVAYQGISINEQSTVGIDLTLLSASRDFTNHLHSTSQMSSTRFLVGASYSYWVVRWCAPYFRIAGGIGENTLKMNEWVSPMNGSVTLWEGRAGAGMTLRTKGWHLGSRADSLVFGIVGKVEGGYVLGTNTSYNLEPRMRSENATPIATTPIHVGTVSNRSPYLRVSVGVGF